MISVASEEMAAQRPQPAARPCFARWCPSWQASLSQQVSSSSRCLPPPHPYPQDAPPHRPDRLRARKGIHPIRTPKYPRILDTRRLEAVEYDPATCELRVRFDDG